MSKKLSLAPWLILTVMGFCSASRAEIKLAVVFSDNLVLQRGVAVPVWGVGEPGEAVSVSVAGQTAQGTVDKDGKWMVKLPALTAGGPFEMTVAGKNTLTVHNVAIGEVWIASGQSNMEFPLATWSKAGSDYALKAQKEIEAANDPMLRMFYVIKKTAEKPQDSVTEVKGQWDATTPKTAGAGGFTAVGYYFARELRQKLNVPVGIIHTSWGGTPAEAWTSKEMLESKPELKKIVDDQEKRTADFDVQLKKYDELAEKAKADGKPAPKKPVNAWAPGNPHRAASLFNGMIAPLIPYAINGAIWYQGESNAGNAPQYRTLFPAMIQDWRNRWGQGEFPFIFVQLANFQKRQTVPSEGGWAGLREAQTMTLSLPHTGMAVAIDLADPENPGDIHPHNKQEVGRRLALNALATVYGQKLDYSGPLYSGVKINGNQATLSFTQVDGGLAAHGDKLEGFAIAGADGKFVWGDAKIEGETVVVSSAEVKEPTAVRYSWAANPVGNLYNKAGLPASPFRTDPDAAK